MTPLRKVAVPATRRDATFRTALAGASLMLCALPATASAGTPMCLLLSDPKGDATVGLAPYRDDGSIGVGTLPSTPPLDIRRAYVRGDRRSITVVINVEHLGAGPDGLSPTGVAYVAHFDLPNEKRVTFVAENTVDGVQRGWFSDDPDAYAEYPATVTFDVVKNQVSIRTQLSYLPAKMPPGALVRHPHVVSMRPIGAQESTSRARTFVSSDEARSESAARVGATRC